MPKGLGRFEAAEADGPVAKSLARFAAKPTAAPVAKGADHPAVGGADGSAAEGSTQRGTDDADVPVVPGAQDSDRTAPENAVATPAPASGPAPDPTPPRPGDAARAALRGAVAARRSSPADGAADDAAVRSDVGAAADTSAAAAGSTAGETDRVPDAAPPAEATPGDTAHRPDTRPADAAREALRAARKRRADAAAAEAEAARVRRSRRSAPAASPDRSRTPRPATGVRARDVRELLADAFRMPADPPPPREESEDNAGTRQESSLPGSPVPDDSPEGTRPADRTIPGNRPAPAAPAPADETLAPTGTTSPVRPGGASAPTGDDSSAQTGEPLARTGTGTGSPTQPTEPIEPSAHPDADNPWPPAAHPPTPAPPHRPHSMAAPSRDNDLRRTFPAFQPRPSEDTRFAATWWGNAWVTALEEGALDAKRLERGRGYAEQGHVDAITVTPGLVLAYVQGSRPRPYRVQVRLRTLGEADWDRFLDLAADRTGHIAALLDKEMPQSLAECGVPLLPGPGDLEPQCSCPDRGHPCKHAAALCYQTARLLDADPFVLLLLRGRGERELLDALSRLSAARAARAAREQEPTPLPGVRAGEALAPRRLPPLPAPLPVPPHPEQPPAYPASPGGPDPFALDQLATDAAARAHALLGTGRDPVGELTLWQDAVRLAAARPGSGLTAGTRALYASLAAATDRTPADLARAVAAWRQGGLEGLAVLEESWDPPAGRFDRARPLLLAADLPAFRPWRNHLTHPRGHVQLRLGRDGLWYDYESEPGHDDWWPRGTPDLDPVGALTGLGTPSGL
ncbi:SWIM zinc finger family protein [Streptomyces sp. NPDC019531]|uniref:SWIM zinc finger family protein n=1 Tax=Streptomyces sp. NPDC019531 TaxID=3365062 RepID=UPI00384D7E86